MHTKTMSDLEGNFGSWKKSNFKCRFCKSDQTYYQIWESSCGGYEDEKHECRSCKKTWWVEGPDS